MAKHILSIDDEEIIRELIAEFLSGLDYRVTGVSSGAEALVVIDSDPPDLIITDLQLENSDGLELIESYKAKLPDIPVILLTGMLFDAHVVEARIASKVSAYIPKTAPLSGLPSVIQRVLEQNNKPPKPA